MSDKIRKFLKIALGIGLIVAGIFGVTEFMLDPFLAEIVRAIAVLVLAIAQRYQPKPA